MTGRLIGIHLTGDAGAPTRPVEEVRAIPGRGLEGDRYFLRAGTYSKNGGPGREVTLIEAEALRAAEADEGVSIPAGGTRRNLVTEGVALNHLVGREFSVGAVRLLGVKLCEPCMHMESLCGVPGARKALIHRGGLRAQILEEGTIRVGDEVTPAG